VKILTVFRIQRSRFPKRFPRLAYWLTTPDTLSALALGLWGSAIAEVAAGLISRHVLWFLAIALLLVAVYRVVTGATHTALHSADAHTAPAPVDVFAFDWTGPSAVGGTRTGKTDGLDFVTVQLRAEYELLAAAYRETARRYEHLRAAAQAAVVESRTSRRNPVTPIAEALALLDEMPALHVQLHDLPLSTSAAWPGGDEVEA